MVLPTSRLDKRTQDILGSPFDLYSSARLYGF